jgi:hypothetical protein
MLPTSGIGPPFGTVPGLPTGSFQNMNPIAELPAIGYRIVSDRIARFLFRQWRYYSRANVLKDPYAAPPQLAPSRRNPYLFFTDSDSLRNGELPHQFAKRVELSEIE